ncbi:MAG: hypothetical protein JJU27_05890 [Gammaproteobacteria bacterium]|nr:hypothetical protein [Gammaproteobacteria bacterium]
MTTPSEPAPGSEPGAHPATEPAPAQVPRRSWREAWSVYAHPRIAAMACLGFSAGLPFLLVFSTLTAWLSAAGVSRTAIGLFTWVGITYSVKVLWSPVVDRLELPLLHRLLGRRRSWILLAQLAIAGGLIGMAGTDPATDLLRMAAFAVLVAFGSATQDIAIDAWRIAAAPPARHAALEEGFAARGVDSDAELSKLLLLEQAYGANARVLASIDAMLRRILEI